MNCKTFLDSRTAPSDKPSSVSDFRDSRQIHIALIRQEYRIDGGGERFVSALMSVLRSQGHQVTLITRNWDGRSDAVLQCNPPRIGRVLRDWWFARAVNAEVRNRDFDLVQSHERIPGCEVYRAGDGVHREWLRQRKRILTPLARVWLNASPYHSYLKLVEKRLFENTNLRLVICNSRMVMQEIRDNFRIDPRKLRLVYNGVDTERFHPQLRENQIAVRTELGIPATATVFIFVGSGFERKGLRQVIQALSDVSSAHLIVVGKDKSLGRFRRYTQWLGVTQRVHFVGVQDHVGWYYGAADTLVLPTLYDPFPNVILEAMAAGLPVITSTKCGGAEVVQPGVSGYVCDALDRYALTRAMNDLTDRSTCARFGIEARRTVESFTLQHMRCRLSEIYQEILDERAEES